MKYALRFEKRALKDLNRLEKRDRERIIAGIEGMTLDMIGDVKKLSVFKPRYRLRVGNFRVLFEVENSEFAIHRIKDRREAY